LWTVSTTGGFLVERSNWWQKLPSSCLVRFISHFRCFWSLRS
jgi:hypothetical protein